MRVFLVAGARPNFMKIGPIYDALSKAPETFQPVLIHTGQHYDDNMSKVFFDDLGLPAPDHHLGVGSGSHAQQTARTMIAFERIVLAESPDMVLVVGDVNPTLACALVAVKLHIPVAHVEAGVRSFDRRMPEEVNRVATDAVADLLLTPSEDAAGNLTREGIPETRIHFVGNVMIDALFRFVERARTSAILEELGLAPKSYGLVTLHRPSNVDDQTVLSGLLDALETVSERLPLVFPLHPRTKGNFERFRLMARLQAESRIRPIPPAGYLDFLRLQAESRLILTDSGGIQAEATALGIPCLTLRENTEWRVTLTRGTNQLVGTAPEAIVAGACRALDDPPPADRRPALWDGHAAERIAEVLSTWKPLCAS